MKENVQHLNTLIKKKDDSMGIMGNFREVIRASIHPNGNTKKMGIGDALRYYYTALPMPIALFALAIIISIIISLAEFLQPGFAGMPIGFSVAILFATVLVGILFSPIYLLLGALILHFFSKILFNIIKGPLERTYAAVIYGTMPALMLLFLLSLILVPLEMLMLNGQPVNANANFVPFIIILAGVAGIIGIWNAVVTIISLSKQHKVSGKRALLAYLLPTLIFAAIVFAFALVDFAILGTLAAFARFGI